MSREKVVLQAEDFTTVEESQVSEETKKKSQTENGVYVKGMALPFGKTSRNGVQYTKESVEKAHEDLVGRSMLFNHKQDWVTGHILNTEITKNGMLFEGDVNPNAEMPNGVTVAEAIERGDINSVSIQAFIEQLGEPADEDAVIDDMETEKVAVKDFLEISAVSIPGFPSAEAMPEHLRYQGVKPMSEALGIDKKQLSRNREAKKEEKETKENKQDEKEEETNKESFEFSPTPDHVLYSDKEDAVQRAKNLGLEDVHEHEMSGQMYYMAGDNHEEWMQAVNKQGSTDEGKSKEPFAGYSDWEECIKDNQDKDNPEAYCGELKDRVEYLDENNATEDDENMSDNQKENEEDQTENKEKNENQVEMVSGQEFEEFVASHEEGADVSDVTEALADYEFTGLDMREVATLIGAEVGVDTGTVLDALSELEGAEGYGKDKDDDEEDEDESGNQESVDEEKQEMQEKIDELENRIEALIDEDEATSKQDSPGEKNEELIPRKPSFKDTLN